MARYRDAIAWIAAYDDTEWLNDDDPVPSVTACLVADLFDKTSAQVELDLRAEVAQQQKKKGR